jgi:hypothetical protein
MDLQSNVTCYYENGSRIAVDHTTAVDVLEPETEPTHEIDCDLLTLTEKIASTYLRGDPEITRIAWRFLLKKEPMSIRACASRAGCSAAAISKRVRVLSEQCRVPLSNPKIRELRRVLAKQYWEEQKRREDVNLPAASDDQSKTNTFTQLKGARL